MKLPLTLILAAGAASLVEGTAPAQAAVPGLTPPAAHAMPLSALQGVSPDARGGAVLMTVGDDGWFGGDDEDDDSSGDCEDDDDEGNCARGNGRAGNPAKAGTVPAPSNGLFGNGKAPSVTTN